MARRERDVARRELAARAREALALRELPGELAGVLDYSGAEALDASLDSAERAFRAAVQRGMEQRLRGEPPRSGGSDPARPFWRACARRRGWRSERAMRCAQVLPGRGRVPRRRRSRTGGAGAHPPRRRETILCVYPRRYNPQANVSGTRTSADRWDSDSRYILGDTPPQANVSGTCASADRWDSETRDLV